MAHLITLRTFCKVPNSTACSLCGWLTTHIGVMFFAAAAKRRRGPSRAGAQQHAEQDSEEEGAPISQRSDPI
jgi:hypothetical protein